MEAAEVGRILVDFIANQHKVIMGFVVINLITLLVSITYLHKKLDKILDKLNDN